MDWTDRSWNLVFVAGTIAGGAVARYRLLGDHAVALNPATVEGLQSMGIADAGSAFAPAALFSAQAWTHPVAISMLLVGGILVARHLWWKTTRGGNLDIYRPPAKQWRAYLIGGTIFGLGWAITGACPGPLFITSGAGCWPILIAILGALIGTLIYGVMKSKLPYSIGSASDSIS